MHMKIGIHRLLTVACYTPENSNNERIGAEFEGKLYNILHGYDQKEEVYIT